MTAIIDAHQCSTRYYLIFMNVGLSVRVQYPTCFALFLSQSKTGHEVLAVMHPKCQRERTDYLGPN